MEAVECGAAALAMVLGHFGRFVPLEELRVACGVSRDGSKALNVVKAARTFGLLSKGYKKEPAQLRDLPLPLIVFWNFNHFVVVEGFRGGRVYLNDPAHGPRVVSDQEFDESFTGVVLVFEKGPDFQPGGAPPSVLRALRHRLPGTRLALAYAVLATLALVLPGMVVPVFSRIFVDSILVQGSTAWLRPMLLAMAVTAVVTGLLTLLQQRGLLAMETRLATVGASRFFWHVLRLPMEFFSQRFGGDIVSRVEINDTVAALLSGELATSLVGLLMVGFFAALMFQYDVLLTLLAIGVAVLNLVVLQLLARRRRDASLRLLQERGKLVGASMAGLQSLETLKASGTESEFFSTWAGHQARVVTSENHLGVVGQYLSAVPPLLAGVNAAAVIGFGSRRIMDGVLTMGMLLAFQTLLQRFVEPVNQLMALGGRLQEVAGDMNRLDDVLRCAPDPLVAGGLEAPPGTPDRLEGGLQLCDITFGYSRLEPPLIAGFSLTLTPGQRVALVGGSGSGKSTVAKVVVGLFQAWSGEVRFDGTRRDDLPRGLVARSVAMVDQDITLFEGTIRDNLTLWDDTVEEPTLLQAARDACIHDDIANRPGGYDYRVEEQGRNFSGGQRQRLEIARAMVSNPRILVLDEATSALDVLTEKRVDDALRRRGCTCLIVAHRLSTIRDCDEIIVLERGAVVERGTHDDLVAKDGAYARLIRTH
ncbi:MAG: NHLP family bacteriocin export ABC transporter peptidase/permease/ATPase subunit [Acidobacteria bacterium]|nr:NHLP family bacteriocin export ABC transporter peptidase/permease/ATPase subunit [Acidobacteriota bacterium]